MTRTLGLLTERLRSRLPQVGLRYNPRAAPRFSAPGGSFQLRCFNEALAKGAAFCELGCMDLASGLALNAARLGLVATRIRLRAFCTGPVTPAGWRGSVPSSAFDFHYVIAPGRPRGRCSDWQDRSVFDLALTPPRPSPEASLREHLEAIVQSGDAHPGCVPLKVPKVHPGPCALSRTAFMNLPILELLPSTPQLSPPGWAEPSAVGLLRQIWRAAASERTGPGFGRWLWARRRGPPRWVCTGGWGQLDVPLQIEESEITLRLIEGEGDALAVASAEWQGRQVFPSVPNTLVMQEGASALHAPRRRFVVGVVADSCLSWPTCPTT